MSCIVKTSATLSTLHIDEYAVRYPHSYDDKPNEPSLYGYERVTCSGCGRIAWFCVRDTTEQQDGCPAAMLQHIAELERLQASIIRARSTT